jgi:hypothetical protein
MVCGPSKAGTNDLHKNGGNVKWTDTVQYVTEKKHQLQKVRHCFSLFPGGFIINFLLIFLHETHTMSFYNSPKNKKSLFYSYCTL